MTDAHRSLRLLIMPALLLALLLGCTETATLDAGPADAGPSDASGIGDSSPADAGASDAGGGACGMTCAAATPVCDATSGACVQCLGPGDCSTPTAMCDTATNLCVTCLADTDCTDPTAARCDAGACVPCTDAGQCVGIAGLGVCETGACVECTVAEASACGLNPCRPDLRCSMYGTDELECAPCDTDANCAAGRVCMEQTYDDPVFGVVVGNFCAWRIGAPLPGPNGVCGLSSQPYARLETVTTVDGETNVNVCVLRTTTCVAFNQHSDPDCDTAFADEQCGATGQNDGRCRLRAGDGMTLCTYPCGNTEDCRPGFTCPPGGDQVCSI